MPKRRLATKKPTAYGNACCPTCRRPLKAKTCECGVPPLQKQYPRGLKTLRYGGKSNWRVEKRPLFWKLTPEQQRIAHERLQHYMATDVKLKAGVRGRYGLLVAAATRVAMGHCGMKGRRIGKGRKLAKKVWARYRALGTTPHDARKQRQEQRGRFVQLDID